MGRGPEAAPNLLGPRVVIIIFVNECHRERKQRARSAACLKTGRRTTRCATKTGLKKSDYEVVLIMRERAFFFFFFFVFLGWTSSEPHLFGACLGNDHIYTNRLQNSASRQ